MEITDYKKQHVAVMAVQASLIALGLGNVVYQLFLNFGSILSGNMNTPATYILTFLAYVSVLIYAFWGYKNSVVPFRLAVTFYSFSLVASLVKLTNTEQRELFGKTGLLLFALLVLAVVFDNTFKKHKKAALISGAAIVAIEAVRSGMILFTLIGRESSASEISASQPFACFLLVCALFITYASRCHWSAFGKLNMFD